MVELMVILHINLHITYRKLHITLHTHIYILISIRHHRQKRERQSAFATR